MKFLLLILSLSLLPAQAVAADLLLMVLDHNSYLAGRAVKNLDIGVKIKMIAAGDLKTADENLRSEIDQASVLVVDVMGREIETFLTEKINLGNKTIYALRGSTDDERLKRLGFTFDDQVAEYYRHISKKNIQNMLRLVANRHFDSDISFSEVMKKPQAGIYYPEAGEIFADVAAYERWQQIRKKNDPTRPRIGILFYSSYLTEGQEKPIKTIISRLEKENFSVLPCFGRDQQAIERFFLDEQGRARVDIVLAFSLKFYSALTPELAAALRKLNVPVINAISLYKDTLDQWRASPVGIDGNEVTWAIATPELSGLIEPTPLAAKQQAVDPDNGRTYFISEPIGENIDRLIPRLHKWLKLQRMANRDKKVAIMFYNHSQGKQNIGASYLNVFASLQEVIRGMAADGYSVGDPPAEEQIKKMILTSARNIGSWAPGELERLLQSSQVVRLPVAQYKKWFKELPLDFQKNVIQQWGSPESSKIMKDGDDFIIPAVMLDNLVLLPEPSRGWGDEPMKLYHDTTLFPHHQYLAVYLWLAHGFRADAMIHLGTHATYEWTPGKQAGLTPSCAPEVLIGNIPGIYPYIVDDVGEGIQAKRRGRAVIISHLTPMLKEAGFYAEYGRMAELANDYKRARTRNSETAPEKLKELMALAKKTGILADIAPETTGLTDDEQVHLLGHHLEEIRENLIPYGLHTFGRSPAEQEITDMARAVVKWNQSEQETDVRDRLRQSGHDEIAGLLAGLRGRFVPPGEGNDPVRNPAALPTGRNFYGYSPQKNPSPAAWELGKKAADEIIANHIKKHKKYPNKVAVVLWATETQRNEGVNESTILYLMGIRPKWSGTGRVVGVEVIPGHELGRPRIDVLVNASGLYRDLFPDKMELIDQAVQLALRQTDIDNLLLENSSRLRLKLQAQGVSEKEAEELSRLRIFSEQPGSYGTGVAEMASGSGIWQDERQVVDVFENRMGFVFGKGRWGAPASTLLKENLAEVDVTIQSRSSNVYGLLDNDDMFQYLGGLSMAVRLESGAAPETLVSQQQKPGQITVEDMAKTLGREMRSRYLNPLWIKGMQKEDYAGAREMAHFVEYLWGWAMTTPEKVDDAKWLQAYEVYVKDKYELNMKEFFHAASPWAHQSITGRMLETVRKGYWSAPEPVQKKLAVEYALSVVEKGVACCEHTCNNPLLNQMVVSIISLPGVMSPEMVEKFKLAIEQAAQVSLTEQVVERKALQKIIRSPGREKAAKKQKSDSLKQEMTEVEGYRMEKMERQDDSTQVTSSGVEWLASLVILFIIGLMAYGVKKKGY